MTTTPPETVREIERLRDEERLDWPDIGRAVGLPWQTCHSLYGKGIKDVARLSDAQLRNKLKYWSKFRADDPERLLREPELMRELERREALKPVVNPPEEAFPAGTLDAPTWPRNGREAGAWAAGKLTDDDVLHVAFHPDHVDGAVTVLVAAGARVKRVNPDANGNGRVLLELST